MEKGVDEGAAAGEHHLIGTDGEGLPRMLELQQERSCQAAKRSLRAGLRCCTVQCGGEMDRLQRLHPRTSCCRPSPCSSLSQTCCTCGELEGESVTMRVPCSRHGSVWTWRWHSGGGGGHGTAGSHSDARESVSEQHHDAGSIPRQQRCNGGMRPPSRSSQRLAATPHHDFG